MLSSLSFLDRFPDPLQLAILIGLNHFEPDVRMEALNIARRFNIKEDILSKIKIIGQDLDKTQKERASAIQVLVRHQGRLASDLFFFLVDLLEKKQTQIILRRQAAQSLGSLRLHLLTERQSDELLKIISEASSYYLSDVIKPFTRGRKHKVSNDHVVNNEDWNLLGNKLSLALESSPGFKTIGNSQRQKILKTFSSLDGSATNQNLLNVMGSSLQSKKKQDAEIDSLMGMLNLGNASRGRVLFHEERVSCGACHRVGDRGDQLGPNLSKISKIRQPRDLLEAILYPNLTIVNGYEYYTLSTTDKKTLGGIIQRENNTAVYLKNANMRDVRVPRDKIHSISNSSLSIMPSGFSQILSQQELLDIVAFLQTCR